VLRGIRNALRRCDLLPTSKRPAPRRVVGTGGKKEKKKKKKKKKKEEAPDDNAAWLPLPEKRPVGWACGPSHVRIGKKTLRSLSGGREGWREGRGGEEGEARER
jgi:hypothetical protein